MTSGNNELIDFFTYTWIFEEAEQAAQAEQAEREKSSLKRDNEEKSNIRAGQVRIFDCRGR